MTTDTPPVDWLGLARETGALLEGEFVLTSGKRSPFYFDCRPLSLDPAGTHALGTHFFERLKDAGVGAVGGMAVGAVPIVAAVAHVSHLAGRPLPGFFVRDAKKGHGRGRQIEGNLPEDISIPVAIIEDVVTTGGSILAAIDAVEEAGNPIAEVMCVLDRDEGGREALAARGYELKPILAVETGSDGTLRLRAA